MQPEVTYPMHTDNSNLDLIPRPADQRGLSTPERLKVTITVTRKPGREEGDKPIGSDGGETREDLAKSSRSISLEDALTILNYRVTTIVSLYLPPSRITYLLPYDYVSSRIFVCFVLAALTFTINQRVSLSGRVLIVQFVAGGFTVQRSERK